MAISLDEFRRETIAFLDANAKPRTDAGRSFRWGEGSDHVSIIDEKEPGQDEAALGEAKAWARLRYDAGLGWIDGPPEYGGRGLSPEHRQLYRSVEMGYDLPEQSYFTIGLGMVAPAILATAVDEAIKRTYLPKLYRGDMIACQLFSEPNAGSDLASLTTRAVRDGDEWVITGQKVWTSNAGVSDIGEIITRTDPEQPKHKGLTAFLVDMRAPGVDVRPLRQMTGGSGFNEVFLNEVRVTDSHRLGGVNDGWSVALSTLQSERSTLANGLTLGKGPGPFERLIAMLRHFDCHNDPNLRQLLARLYSSQRTVQWTLGRGMAKAAAGQSPAAELSILKLMGSNELQLLSEFVGEILGPRLVADTGEWGTFAWGQLVCAVPGGRLGGGTDEIQRNVIAERILGLPREPRTLG